MNKDTQIQIEFILWLFKLYIQIEDCLLLLLLLLLLLYVALSIIIMFIISHYIWHVIDVELFLVDKEKNSIAINIVTLNQAIE